MANTISPNMSLIIPGVGTEAGPTYAFDINASLSLIDQHDHSPGRGVQITPAGLNINQILDFNGNIARGVASVEFFYMNTSTADTTLGSISVAPGSGVSAADLWFTDGSGNTFQITKSGAVNAGAASIPGETYSAGTFIWTQDQSALPTRPANFDIGSITLRPNIDATTYGVMVSPPTGIASQYPIYLPLLPGSQSFMTIDASGVMSAPIAFTGGITASNIANATITGNKIASATITGSNIASATITGSNIASATIVSTNIANNTILDGNIAPATITRDKLAAVGQQISTSSGTFSTASMTPVDVTNLSVSLTTTGRPVMIFMASDGTSNNSYISYTQGTPTGAPFIDFGVIQIMIGASVVAQYNISSTAASPATDGNVTILPPSSVLLLSTLSAGTYTIKIRAEATNGGNGGILKVNHASLYAYEL